MRNRLVWIVGLSCLVAGAALADEKQEAQDKKPAAPTEIPEPKVFVTQHSGRFGGQPVRYQATCGETYLRDDKGEPTASIFSFAYTMEGVEDAAARPVMFLWNGGPGSSSVWLHMGTFGPRRADVPSDARDDGAPPYPIDENQQTVLDLTDLVFVDPVGTGFSRALGKTEDKKFWGLEEDAESIASFIRVWVTEHGRWNSPKYIAGESFGTTRAAAVAALLEGGSGVVSLNGLILVSQALDYEGSTPRHENLASFITYVPTMAATAWYHGKVPGQPADLEALLEEARRFAYDEYAPALLRGSGLGAEERTRIRERLAFFTGLGEAYVERSDLRILASRFLKELLRGEGKAVGRLDGRYTGDDIDDVAERPEGDPSSYGISGAYTATLHHYMSAELNIGMDRPYKTSNRQIGRHWKWSKVPEGRSAEPSYVNVGRRLGSAMRRNSELRVLVASGYYDFATPFFDAELTFDRHGIVPERVTMTYYEAGHMMYLHDPSRERFLADVRAFLRAASD